MKPTHPTTPSGSEVSCFSPSGVGLREKADPDLVPPHLYEGGGVVKGVCDWWGRLVSSLYCRLCGSDQVLGGSLRWPNSGWVVYAAKGETGLAGAKGWLRVHIHQAATAMRRATSMRAILGPRCGPRR